MRKKFEKRMIIAMPGSLFSDFSNCCNKEIKTMSEVIRNFMLQYIKEHRKWEKK